jgi:hypothetical protein
MLTKEFAPTFSSETRQLPVHGAKPVNECRAMITFGFFKTP